MKTYSKPEILFEDFSLSTNIANTCELQTSFALNSCAYYIDVMPGVQLAIFTESVDACTEEYADDGTPIPGVSNDSVCYHVPAGGPNVFNS